VNDENGFRPYKRDGELVRPWAIPGTPGLEHRLGGLEKQDGTGDVMRIETRTTVVTHQADRLHLPPGYELNYGADVLLLLRDDGSVVAAFSARGTTPSEVARTAEEDYGASGDSSV
jgi:hypothetical protein